MKTRSVTAMPTQLEHANLSVRQIDAMIQFITTAIDDFHVRHDAGDGAGRWVHVGNDSSYIALNVATQTPNEAFKPYGGMPGCNHLGFVVSDAEAVAQRLTAGGYTASTYPNAHPHRKRVYFLDPEGNDWEFVEYLAETVAERNDYALPDR